ncbi:hypothetical protein [Rhizobium sp. TRM95796]|uniref:hypothetical protein n=1 Tax=Rhizobium sp. TRM95796 TaxID=2979862 RepID=UPI0021E9557E|nr:hypothetical protein [Rhizobium sp. TRM95796]MCV3765787.1 hypothetical protein [Rhizobium sp. TRM95796]
MKTSHTPKTARSHDADSSANGSSTQSKENTPMQWFDLCVGRDFAFMQKFGDVSEGLFFGLPHE